MSKDIDINDNDLILNDIEDDLINKLSINGKQTGNENDNNKNDNEIYDKLDPYVLSSEDYDNLLKNSEFKKIYDEFNEEMIDNSKHDEILPSPPSSSSSSSISSSLLRMRLVEAQLTDSIQISNNDLDTDNVS